MAASIVALAEALRYAMRRGVKEFPKADTSGAKPPEYWKSQIEESTYKGVMRAFETRNEKIREIVREEMESFLRSRGL